MFNTVTIPNDLANDHHFRGGRELQLFMTDVHDGELRVMVGLEPAGPKEEFIRHASTSVGKPNVRHPFRGATQDEGALVLRMISERFPSVEWEIETRGMVTHYWETV
jgi:hypothetical protein